MYKRYPSTTFFHIAPRINAMMWNHLAERIGKQPRQTGDISRLNPTGQIHDNEPPNPNRFASRPELNLRQGSHLDEDFHKSVPLTSLVYRDTLSIDFEIQTNVQDQHNIDIARGVISHVRPPGHGDSASHQGVPPHTSPGGTVERGFGMDKRSTVLQALPTSSHSMPELSGSIHCHQLSPVRQSRGPMRVHHSHSFDQSSRTMLDVQPEFAARRSQYNEPTMTYHGGQSNVPYAQLQTNVGFSAAMQPHQHSSQDYSEQQGSTGAHLLPSSPVQQQQPYWPSTQSVTYQQTSYTRPVSTTIHPPNAARQVSDPRLLRNRHPSADAPQRNTPVTGASPFGADDLATNVVGDTAAMTIQNQNLAERLSVGPSPSSGTSVQPHLVLSSPSSTGQSTGRICGTAVMELKPTERRIAGDDKCIEAVIENESANVLTAGATVTGATVDCDEMSDDLVDQIVRGCTVAVQLKPNVMPPTDGHLVSMPCDNHPLATAAASPDVVTSQQLSKMSHEISEEMARIKMLQESVKAATEKLSQNAAAAAATTTTTTSSVAISLSACVAVTKPTVPSVPSVVAAHPTNTIATETAILTRTPHKSDIGTCQQHSGSNQTIAARKPHSGKKERVKEKETPAKREKGTSVIRTANDMKLFLNANKVHKHDSRVSKRTVAQKLTDPRTPNG